MLNPLLVTLLLANLATAATIERAEQLYTEGRYEECIAECDKLSRPRCDAAALTLMGKALGRMGQLQAAQGRFSQSVICDSTYAEAYYGLGTVEIFTGDFISAESRLLRAMSLGFKDAGLFRNIGGLYVKMGRLQDARAILEKGSDSFPSHTAILHNLGSVYADLGLPLRAINTFETLSAIEPQNPEPKTVLADLYFRAGASRKTLEVLQTPSDQISAIRLCKALVDQEQYRQTLPLLRSTLEQNPDDTELKELLALSTYHLGMLDDAARLYAELSTLDSDYISVAEAVKDRVEGPRHVIARVPNLKQLQERPCLQASVLSVGDYWLSVDSLWTMPSSFEGYLPDLEAFALLRKEGLPFVYRSEEGDFPRLQSLIKNDRPVIVLWGYSDSGSLHSVTVVGYDEGSKLVLVNDPFESRKHTEITYSDFLVRWNKSGNGFFLVEPDSLLAAGESPGSWDRVIEGYALWTQGSEKEALTTIGKISLDSAPYFTAMMVGEIYFGMGRGSLALEAFSRAREINSGQPFTYLALSRYALQQGDFEAARKFVLTAGQESDPVVRLILAEIFILEGDYENALSELGKAASQLTGISLSKGLYLLGAVNFRLRRLDLAMQSFKDASTHAVTYYAALVAQNAIEDFRNRTLSHADAIEIIDQFWKN